MQVSVFHTPELVPDGTPDCAVAIDVLRATSTIATALANGAEAVQVYSDIDELNKAAAAFSQDRVLRGGERDGKQLEGFDFGNSPFFCTHDNVREKRLFISTTNGTRTLQRIRHAPVVLTAALVNVGYVGTYIREGGFEKVWLVGSGWQGNFSLEDTVCAGVLVEMLEKPANDEAVAAAALYDTWRDDLPELLEKASHGQRLLKLGLLEDILYCAQVDTVRALPRQVAAGVLVQGFSA